MPRRQRPAFEAAVAASPLFKLALEIRIMVYELLLIQKGGILIPSDIFVRRDYGRTGSIPYECSLCGLVFLSKEGCWRHISKYQDILNKGCYNLPSSPPLPEVSVSILQTCRVIRLEASPILYSNCFHFCDPATMSNFRWSTDCAQAGSIQDIGFKFSSYSFDKITPWLTYLTKRTFSLGQDFTHLRRVTITLHTFSRVKNTNALRLFSKRFRERSPALEWVLVLMLINEEVVDCFDPLVDRKDEPNNGEKEVQRRVWANKRGGPWKNALLWWGTRGEAVPHKYRMIGDQPQQGI